MWQKLGLCIVGMAVSGMLLHGQLATAAPDSTAETPKVIAADGIVARRSTPTPPTLGEGTLSFRNDVGSRFQLIEARFSLDGIELPTVVTQAQHGRDYVVYAGHMDPGRHVLASRMRFQGRNRAVFTYMRGYSLNLEDQKEIYSVSGSATYVSIIASDHMGFNVPFKNSVAVVFEERRQAVEERGPTVAAVLLPHSTGSRADLLLRSPSPSDPSATVPDAQTAAATAAPESQR